MSAVPRWAEAMPRTQHQAAGFTLLELVIVIILVILLFLVAFNRLLPLRGDAESAHVATMVGTLQSAIGMEAAMRVTRYGIGQLAALDGINPMALLQEPPANYLGEDPPGTVPPGSWYFDSSTSQLLYRVRYPQYLDRQLHSPVHLAWLVVVEISGDEHRPSGIRLVPGDNPGWQTDARR